MKIVIILEYGISLIFLLLFHMYMFQLNSYLFSKHVSWIKLNYKKVIIQILLIVIPFILILFNNSLLEIIAILFLGVSIFYNFPKTKSKIPFKITNRVKRMFITEAIIFFIILILNNIQNYIYIKLCILNILSIFICVLANIINFPIERLIKRKYINQAKKILKDMPNLIVIGVTGSYGKTSVKNFMVKTLSTKYEVLTTPKNYNTPMGIVKTIRENLKSTHQIFVCEMGAATVGEIKEICDIVNPKIGIITAIGPQHLETFKSIDNIVKTKFELLDAVRKNNGTMFLNYDNEYLKTTANPDVNIITYGINNTELNYSAYDITSSANGLKFKILDKYDKEIEFKTKLIGKHNVVNILGVMAVSEYLGIPLDRLVTCVRGLKSVEHRLEVTSHGNLTIIDDSYNSNPISSKSALETLDEFEGTKIIVTPGLIELGEDEVRYNFEFGKYITDVCDYIFLVGNKHSKLVLDGISSSSFDKKKVFIVDTHNEAIEKIEKMNINGKINVLLENDLPDNYNL